MSRLIFLENGCNKIRRIIKGIEEGNEIIWIYCSSSQLLRSFESTEIKIAAFMAAAFLK